MGAKYGLFYLASAHGRTAGRAAVSAVTKEFFFSKTETSTDEMYPLKGSQSPFLDKSTFERTTIYVPPKVDSFFQ